MSFLLITGIGSNDINQLSRTFQQLLGYSMYPLYRNLVWPANSSSKVLDLCSEAFHAFAGNNFVFEMLVYFSICIFIRLGKYNLF